MKKVDYTIVFVSDMSRSVKFYRDVMGFPLKFECSKWTEFATEGTTLALHPAERTPAGSCQPGLVVDNMGDFHRSMIQKGVRCLMPPTMQDFGSPLALYADPDGMVFSVIETPKK